MGCSYHVAEKFSSIPLANVLKAGYESSNRPRFTRGACCELLDCRDIFPSIRLARTTIRLNT
jgi:hypothetical protein